MAGVLIKGKRHIYTEIEGTGCHVTTGPKDWNAISQKMQRTAKHQKLENKKKESRLSHRAGLGGTRL